MKEIDWTDDAYESIVRTLGARTGLVFRPSQRDATQQGIELVMRGAGVADPAQFARLLGHDVDALDDLIVRLTVGETYFFREPDHFRAVRTCILPEIRERLGTQHRIRIWSAGCASGEEAYSLGMLCDQEGLAKRCDILGTDISSEALSKAAKATYRQWSLRGDGAATATEYLRLEDGEYHLDHRIRRLARFEFLNLAMDVYPSLVTGTQALDLIFCRNVMIYFDRDTICDVARRLIACLASGGWLITASADPPIGDYTACEQVVTEFGVFYRPAASRQAPIQTTRLDWSDWSDSRQERTLGEVTPDAAGVHPEPAAAAQTEKSTTEPAPDEGPQFHGAEAALARGDYERAAQLSEAHSADPTACIVHVKALANVDTQQAVRKCTLFTKRHPLSTELHYLHAVLLMERNLDVEAIQAAQRAVFVDRSLAIAHFLVGSILQRRGALEGALRAFRNARRLCEARPPDEIIPLSDNETARDLARAAQHHLQTIETAMGKTP